MPNISNTLNSKCCSSETKPLNNNVKAPYQNQGLQVGEKGLATQNGGGLVVKQERCVIIDQ